MKLRSALVVSAVGLVLTTAAGGCASSDGDSESGGGDGTVPIGLIASRSGAAAAEATGFANGVELAVDQINADGGVLGGRQLDLTSEDDAGNPQTARGLMSQLAEKEVSAVLGPYGSSVTLAAAPVAEQARLPVLAAGTADQIGQQGFQYLFNAFTLGSTFVRGLFDVLSSVNADRPADARMTKIAVLHEDGPYGQNIVKQAGDLAAKAGFQISATLAFTAGEPNLRPLVTRAVDSGAEIIMVGAFKSDMLNVVNAVSTTGNSDKVLVTSFGGPLGDLADVPVADNALWASNWNADLSGRPDLMGWVDEYSARYHAQPTTDAAFGWTAAHVLSEAIDAAGSTDSEAVHNALREISTESPILPPYPITFDKDGSLGSKADQIIGVQIQDGEFRTVWPDTVASTDLRLPAGLR